MVKFDIKFGSPQISALTFGRALLTRPPSARQVMSTQAAPAWHVNLPTPISAPAHLEPETLHEWIQVQGDERDFVVVDVRRTDIEGTAAFMIPTAINLPAQTFYATLPALFPVLRRYKSVIFHCSSSNGRGPRCAAWYQDELDRRSETGSKAFVLRGGIKAWTETYGEEVIRL